MRVPKSNSTNCSPVRTTMARWPNSTLWKRNCQGYFSAFYPLSNFVCSMLRIVSLCTQPRSIEQPVASDLIKSIEAKIVFKLFYNRIQFKRHRLSFITTKVLLFLKQNALFCASLYSGVVRLHLLSCVHNDEPVDRTAACSTALPGVLWAKRLEYAEWHHSQSGRHLHHHDR